MSFCKVRVESRLDNPGVEEVRVAHCETAGFRTIYSGARVLGVIFTSFLSRVGFDDTNE